MASATDTKPLSVRISGKRGKIKVEFDKGTTVADAVKKAAAEQGIAIDVKSITILANGVEVSPDTPVQAGEKIDAVPHARLG